MKHKITATALAGALALTSLIGLTACNGLPKGDEVTAQEWKSAFENSDRVTNYTMEVSSNVVCDAKGKVYSEKSGSMVDASSKIKISLKETTLYNEEMHEAYSESSSSTKMEVREGEEKESAKTETTSKSYYEPSETRYDIPYYWKATYSSVKRSSSDSQSAEKNDEENFWCASETSYFSSASIGDMFDDAVFYETDGGGQAKSVAGLYDKFVYGGGKYTATLYRKVDVYGDVNTLIECTVTVSIDRAKDCVIGFGIECNGKGNLTQSNEYDLDYKYKGKSVFRITDIKKTDASKKANKKIVMAIDKAKAEKARNGAN